MKETANSKMPDEIKKLYNEIKDADMETVVKKLKDLSISHSTHDKFVHLCFKDSDRDYLLTYSVKVNKLDVVRKILKELASIYQEESIDSQQKTMIINVVVDAFKAISDETNTWILRAFIDFFKEELKQVAKERADFKPVIHIVCSGRVAMVRALLEAGFDVSESANDGTINALNALSQAVLLEKSAVEMVKLLVEYKAQIIPAVFQSLELQSDSEIREDVRQRFKEYFAETQFNQVKPTEIMNHVEDRENLLDWFEAEVIAMEKNNLNGIEGSSTGSSSDIIISSTSFIYSASSVAMRRQEKDLLLGHSFMQQRSGKFTIHYQALKTVLQNAPAESILQQKLMQIFNQFDESDRIEFLCFKSDGQPYLLPLIAQEYDLTELKFLLDILKRSLEKNNFILKVVVIEVIVITFEAVINSGFLSNVSHILELFAEQLQQVKTDSFKPMIKAVKKGNNVLLKEILKYNFDVNEVDKKENTNPLKEAIKLKLRPFPTVKTLIEKGAKIDCSILEFLSNSELSVPLKNRMKKYFMNCDDKNWTSPEEKQRAVQDDQPCITNSISF